MKSRVKISLRFIFLQSVDYVSLKMSGLKSLKDSFLNTIFRLKFALGINVRC
jgi:hypothetical protein